MGDTLSLQYGGSEAHQTFFSESKGIWKAASHSKEVLTSMRRYYSNTYMDAEKQVGVPLFSFRTSMDPYKYGVLLLLSHQQFLFSASGEGFRCLQVV